MKVIYFLSNSLFSYFIRNQKTSGQALIEFMILLSIILPLFTLSLSIFWKQWVRVGCLYWTFESTHRKRIDSSTLKVPSIFTINIVQTQTGFIGECLYDRKIIERIKLPNLEKALW